MGEVCKNLGPELQNWRYCGPGKEVRLLSVTPKDPPLSPASCGAFSLLTSPGHIIPVMRRWLGILVLALLLPPAPANAIKGKPRVIDGDTIVIAGERIHLFGIDAPENRQTCMVGQTKWRCGRNAAMALAGIISTHWVLCRERGRDRHGDMLGVCRFAGYRGAGHQCPSGRPGLGAGGPAAVPGLCGRGGQGARRRQGYLGQPIHRPVGVA